MPAVSDKNSQTNAASMLVILAAARLTIAACISLSSSSRGAFKDT